MGRFLSGEYNNYVLILSDDRQVFVLKFGLIIDEFKAYSVSERLSVVE